MDFWELLLGSLDVKILVFARIIGAFAFTPLLSRDNFPTQLKIGASLLITYILTLTMGVTEVDTGVTVGAYMVAILREMFIGVVIGFVMDMFILMVQFAGDIMDSQTGLGMAKVFDPATRIQMSVFGSFISFMLYMYFFVTDCHLTVINIFITSFEIIPLGGGELNPDLGMLICEFFSEILVMTMKLAMPVIAAEMILHFCVGVLMKAVPQIQIMVVNIQLMLAVGFIVLFIIAAPMADFIDGYVSDMLDSAFNIIPQIFV
ncbi:MAG: flagellar biosynthetic protein FliR [Oscillospiraceae bacterium]